MFRITKWMELKCDIISYNRREGQNCWKTIKKMAKPFVNISVRTIQKRNVGIHSRLFRVYILRKTKEKPLEMNKEGCWGYSFSRNLSEAKPKMVCRDRKAIAELVLSSLKLSRGEPVFIRQVILNFGWIDHFPQKSL